MERLSKRDKESLAKIEEDTAQRMRSMKEVREVTAQKGKKLRQADLSGKKLDVPDVTEEIRKVEYYAISEETEKFRLKTKDTAIRGLQAKELLSFVRKRIRPKTNAEIGKGDFDKSAEQIYKKLLDYPR